MEGWRATHRGLSSIDLKFRELAQDSPELLDRARFRLLDEPRELLHYRLQSWPTFLDAEKLGQLKRVSLEIHRLLLGVPQRIFGSDMKKLASFYGLNPTIAEVLFTPPTGAETMISRGDLIETAAGFKCIEFNFTPNLGGWDTTIIKNLQLSLPSTAQFIEREGLRVGFTDTVLEMFRHVIQDVRSKGILRNREVTVAFLTNAEELPNILGGEEYFNREIQRAIERSGFDLRGQVVCCSPDMLTVWGTNLFASQRRVDAVVDLDGKVISPSVYRLFKGDLIGLYNGPLGPILSNKRNVALLSQHAASGIYSPEEQSLIETHIPWTRLVAPGEVDYQGGMYSLYELLTMRQDQFVLKESDGFGGKGVLLGKFSSPEEWRQTLDRALTEGDWVVQEILEFLPYLYQSGEYGCSIHEVIWGPFVFGHRYGGVVLRMQPKAVGGAVNLSLTATEGIVLEV